IRYLPMLSEHEFVLLETHAEGDDAPSGLLRALGLERRRAVARDEIELALLRRGGDAVGSMGLDPRAFRIVCVPPDVYMGVGPSRGWGARGGGVDALRGFAGGGGGALLGVGGRHRALGGFRRPLRPPPLGGA